MASVKKSNGTVLIAGASRGIGLALAEQFAVSGWRVVATARDPAKAAHLNALSKRFAELSIVPLDIADSKSVSQLAGAVRAAGVDTVDVLINNAAIGSSLTETLDTTTVAELTDKFRVNVIGVWEVSREVRPFLKKSLTPRIINISTIIGSIADTVSNPLFAGTAVSYRVSKAALNELTAIQGREYNAEHTAATAPGAKPTGAVPPITTTIAVHPGMVATDMATDGLAAAPEAVKALAKTFMITPKVSAEGIYKLTVDAGAKPNISATFVDYTGKPIAW